MGRFRRALIKENRILIFISDQRIFIRFKWREILIQVRIHLQTIIHLREPQWTSSGKEQLKCVIKDNLTLSVLDAVLNPLLLIFVVVEGKE